MSKADRRKVRELADRAWKIELQSALDEIGTAIAQMKSGDVSPFDVDQQIHEYHNGTARDLYKLYSGSNPWIGVCTAYFKGLLSEDDISELSEELRRQIQESAEHFTRFEAENKE